MSERCKETGIPDSSGWHFHQCSRQATKDGYCWQHHPDYKAQKQREKEERWKRETENSLAFRYERLGEENESQAAEITRLRERVEKLEADRDELQCKYEALVERLEHMAEMWDEKDRAAWRTDPSKHLNGFKCADELRALLEEVKDE